jgi:hypothetical protein
LNQKGQKAARQRKSTTDKRKNAYSKLGGVIAEERDEVDVDVDE